MSNEIKIAEKNIDNAFNGELSSRLKAVISKWAVFAIDYFRDWDEKPNCGHFFGGCYHYGVETSFTMTVLAVLAKIGDYDEDTLGKPKSEIIDKIIKSIRYLCYTHYTGPSDCLREKGRNPVNSGTKWGSYGNNFFRSSQTGVSVSMLGLSSWLLWEHLDDETQEMVYRLLIFYADKYSAMEPGTGTYNDTQCEENAWTSLGISAALYMFPDHPRNAVWKDGYIKWSLNSVSTFKDKLENEYDKVSYKSRGGFKYDGKTYGISSVTFHPDFTTENHGYVHPDYMGAGIILKVSSVIFPLMAGKKPIESIFFNCSNLYNKVLKPWCWFDGNPVPVQGQDWFYHRHQNKLFMHGVMNTFYNDSEAACLEKNCLSIIEGRQDSNNRGCLLEENGESLEVTPGSQSAFDMEYAAIRTVLLTYLLHIYKGEGIEPIPTVQVMKNLRGTYFYPYGGVYIYRTEKTFASFTARCSIMGLSLPANGMWDITTDFQSFTGLIKEKESDDSYFMNKKINWNDIGIECVRKNIHKNSEGFSATVDVPRAKSGISQMTSFSALGSGNSVYVEKLKANRDISLASADTGKISIGNENFRGLKELAKGFRKIYFNNKTEIFNGNYEGCDISVSHKGIKHVNIDDKIGYLVYGSEGAGYTNRHDYPKWKGLEDTLTLNRRGSIVMKNGDETDFFAIVSLPNFTFEETKIRYAKTKVTHIQKDLFVIRTGEYRVSVNFSNEDINIMETLPLENGLVNIYDGMTAKSKTSVSHEYIVKGFSTRVDSVRGTAVLNEDIEELDITCIDGYISIMNPCADGIVYDLSIDGISRKVFHESARAIRIHSSDVVK